MIYLNSSISQFIFRSKNPILLVFIALTFFNCNNNEKKLNDKGVEEETVLQEVVPSLQMGCYTYDQNENLITFEITKNDNPVEGNLSYAFAEKDKNTGTFTGQFKDGKLIGDYTFQSEGKESKRQLAFILKDNQLIEGYAKLNEDGTMFEDVNTIDYSSTMPLSKTDCE